MTLFKKRKYKKHMIALKARVKRDKPIIDYLRKDDNWIKHYRKLAEELNTTPEEINRIMWDYRDVFENDAFYVIDVLQVLEDD